MRLNPLNCIDLYKADHRRQYPKNIELVYSNFTPRSSKFAPIPEALFNGHVTFFGLQHFIQWFLIDTWNEGFFSQPKERVVAAYKRRMDGCLGVDAVPTDHIEALHDLGYLPITIRALPEGTLVPVRVPLLVIYNTHPDFFWLTNYLETIMSCELWKATTSATIAYHYRLLIERYSLLTGASPSFADYQCHDLSSRSPAFVDYQCHDFSFRGLSGVYDAAISGAAHLTSFNGTDTVIALDLIDESYNVNCFVESIGKSVPATEHSVMCAGGADNELATFERLLDLYPSGIVSVVSDTWDFWNAVTVLATALKSRIMARDGKLVFRPDSGDPVKIICGDPALDQSTPEGKGAVRCLWDIFGGTENAKGFKVLDAHVGLIYGDSITLERAEAILSGLARLGFSSENIVFGVGSYTYQYVTRDSFGFAVKSTYAVVDGVGREIFKDPKTDNGVKKSARGLIAVRAGEDGKLAAHDRQASIDVESLMRPVFTDGEFQVYEQFTDIRRRIEDQRDAEVRAWAVSGSSS